VSTRRRVDGALLGALLLLVASSCSASDGPIQTLRVTASAYNSVAAQTNANPTLSAWGDLLKPGMKAIAVSRDLIDLGLTHGVEVEIEGLPGIYIVRDKMAKRWTQKIDIYMGEDVEAARRFGKQTVTIHWTRTRP
jgi:3D (Asp-Asp-Asp) domain-containing protein